MKTNAAVPKRQIVGLKSFLPKIPKIIPTIINKIPHKPIYLLKKDHIALIEATGHPDLDYVYIYVMHGSEFTT